MVYYRGWRIRETLLKVSAYLSAFPVKRSKGIEQIRPNTAPKSLLCLKTTDYAYSMHFHVTPRFSANA